MQNRRYFLLFQKFDGESDFSTVIFPVLYVLVDCLNICMHLCMIYLSSVVVANLNVHFLLILPLPHEMHMQYCKCDT